MTPMRQAKIALRHAKMGNMQTMTIVISRCKVEEIWSAKSLTLHCHHFPITFLSLDTRTAMRSTDRRDIAEKRFNQNVTAVGTQKKQGEILAHLYIKYNFVAHRHTILYIYRRDTQPCWQRTLTRREDNARKRMAKF